MKHNNFDIAVIGGGPIGLSAAYYAAASGHKTVLFEQHPFFHDLGSSGGNSRFFRIMYSEKQMAQLSEVSYALWKQLEKKTGVCLVDEQPLLFFGSKECGDSVEGDFSAADTVMDALGIPYESLTASEIKERYPVFKTIPEDYTGLIQHNSGVIQVQNTLRTFHGLARDAGATLIDGVRVQIHQHHQDSITLKTVDDTFNARSLILAPGAWSNTLLSPLGIQFDFRIWQMTVCLFEVENPETPYPFWYEFGKDDGQGQHLYYGFPVGTDRPNCIKVSCDFTPDMYDSIESCTRTPNQKVVNLIRKHLAQRFEGVHAEPLEVKTCHYTMSSDYHMILGLLPGFSNIAILTGESGRAFKYAPLFGRILTELSSTGESSYNIDCLSIQRENLFA